MLRRPRQAATSRCRLLLRARLHSRTPLRHLCLMFSCSRCVLSVLEWLRNLVLSQVKSSQMRVLCCVLLCA